MEGEESVIIVMNLKNIEKNIELKVNGNLKKLYPYGDNDKVKISNGIVNIKLLPLETKILSTSEY